MENVSNLHVCPSCGNSVSFQNDRNNLAACTCGKVWQRTGEILVSADIELIDQSADFIQPGTTGIWNGLPFTVTGRIRMWFADSCYNYWSFVSIDGKIRYLAEGYGMFAIHEHLLVSKPLTSKDFKSFAKNCTLHVPSESRFEITANNECTFIDLEGAAYLPVITRKIKNIEAVSENRSVEIFEFAGNHVEPFELFPVSADALRLENLREENFTGKEFTCSNCNSKTNVKTFPFAQSWVCANCETRASVMDARLSRENGVNKAAAPEMHIAIGSTITLKDISYQVIGFAYKQNKSSQYDTWNEYTLYNWERGYAFLTESEGHWMLLKEANNAPLPSLSNYSSFYFEGKLFDRFLSYHYLTTYAMGEFPGNVFADQGVVRCQDFIGPPELLCIESGPEGRKTWFRGEYIDYKIIENQVSGLLPVRRGIAPAQPGIVTDNTTLIMALLLAFILLASTQLITSTINGEKKIMAADFNFADSVSSQTFVTEKFMLDKWKSNLQLDIYAEVNNSWFELNATLVSVETGNEYEVQQGIEHYYGVSDGESWSEGGYQETTYFTSVPAGTYFLQLTGMRDTNRYVQVSSFKLNVTNDTPMPRNFVIILFFVVLVPLVLIIMNYYREKERWSDSPYSTYNDD